MLNAGDGTLAAETRLQAPFPTSDISFPHVQERNLGPQGFRGWDVSLPIGEAHKAQISAGAPLPHRRPHWPYSLPALLSCLCLLQKRPPEMPRVGAVPALITHRPRAQGKQTWSSLGPRDPPTAPGAGTSTGPAGSLVYTDPQDKTSSRKEEASLEAPQTGK